ncbi:hypothetical protein THII_3235 [Thioploca ingrica]|uniref:Uncharacterized protein n=1 Tax=Thioploca ingrica TaxID=40754 RepID=A0A090AN79_9GAMM|nr:hypothetical protein THII_3235 [Thioploca ingrica]
MAVSRRVHKRSVMHPFMRWMTAYALSTLHLLGDVSNITIEADFVTLKDGGVIASDTFGDHAGGNLTLKMAGDLTIMGRKSTVTIFPPPFNLVIKAMQSGITSSTLGKGAYCPARFYRAGALDSLGCDRSTTQPRFRRRYLASDIASVS